MSRRFSTLAIFILAVSLPAKADDANCGCEATRQPCTQEALVTLPLPDVKVAQVQTGQEMVFTMPMECWDCGVTNPLPFLLFGLLFSAMIALKRVIFGADPLIVLRLNRSSTWMDERHGDARAELAAEFQGSGSTVIQPATV
jgi:hypothetical protein